MSQYNMFNNTSFGFNNWSTTRIFNNYSFNDSYSMHNNGYTRMGFRTQTGIPSKNMFSNYQARPFTNSAFVPILSFTGNNGLISKPLSFYTIYPDGMPSMSYLTNWGGNIPSS